MEKPPRRRCAGPFARVLGLLVCGMLSGPAAATAARPASDDELRAAEALREAEQHVSRARYSRAVAAYRRLAADWPGTAAGATAAARAAPTAFLGVNDLLRRGPSGNRVDVVIMGDGYTLDQQSAFDDAARTVPRMFEQTRTFSEYGEYFNLRRANLVSAEAGVNGFGREYDTALGAFARGTGAGHVDVDRRRVRAWLAEVPDHDGLVIAFVRRGILGTGRDGVAAVAGRAERPIMMREWGRAFAGLVLEFTRDQGQAPRGPAPTGPNVWDSDDPRQVPWSHWLDTSGVGIYEGAAGRVKGAWKSNAGGRCLMDNADAFCRVCREALVLRIHDFVDPIEAVDPAAHGREGSDGVRLGRRETADFEVTVMQPDSHDVQVRFWVLPGHAVPAAPVPPRGPLTGTRRDRGPLALIETPPDQVSHRGRRGVHTFRVRSQDHPAGRYAVVARAVDTTQVRGNREPWVRADPHGLLESERIWWVEIADGP